ncbi:alpha/beta hydrolase [Streptomyces naganishii]|uniref:Esterase n=1 Tax=Streptomyces naganishii JCM 4654 TaxID=1306179 RepID=A0A919CXH8_9ACTN|nr:alpha/beta hydrolase-fold protein [Streptomyces naganishii]GHD93050.1 esterase [Streptomyces naganishii JCM 4654]
MALTGAPFFFVLIAAMVLAMVGTVAVWSRVGGPRAVRWLVHAAMIVVCQLTAIGVVVTYINNSYGLYASWDDLLGTNGANAVAMPGPPVSRAKFSHGTRGGVLDTYFRGRRSTLSGQVLVWTPPEYDQAAYRKQRFPVLMLLHGVPGSPQSWLEHGGMPGAFADLVKQGKAHPFILVMPVVDPGSVDTDCSDLPQRKVATWLAEDVPDLVRHKFRTLPAPSGWGLMGYSTGGFCAAKLPLQYPKVFAAGAALDPDPLTGDPSVLQDPALRRANSPTHIVAGTHARVSLFLATSRQDRLSPPSAIEGFLAAAAHSRVQVRTLLLADGGHNFNTWSAEYPAAFGWLSRWLPAPR